MFKKLLHGTAQNISSAAAVIAIATLVSRITGLLRDRVFAHYFGASALLDAYYAAFKIPDLIYNLLIVGALATGFIPVFTSFLTKEDKRSAWRLADNMITIAGIFLCGAAGIGMIFYQQLAAVIAPGFTHDQIIRTAELTRIMLWSPVLLGISMVLGGILQSLRQFLLYSLAPIFYNLGIIAGAIFLVPLFGPNGLAWGVVLGATFHLAIQWYGTHMAGYQWHWRFDLTDAPTQRIFKLMIPRTLGVALTQINAVVLTLLASLLPVGSIAVYNFANNLQGVGSGIIGVSLAMAAFPFLSLAASAHNIPKFIEHLAATTRQILFLIIPATLLFLLLRAQIVRVVLGSGAFDWSATKATADTLAFFALGLFAQALIPLFARASYALGNTMIPFLISIIAEIGTLLLAFFCMRSLGVTGLALANSAGAIINCILLFVWLWRKLDGIDGRNTLHALYRMLTAGIVMATLLTLAKIPLASVFDQRYFWGILGQGLGAGLLGLAGYFTVSFFLRVPECRELLTTLQRRWVTPKELPPTEMME